MNDLGVLATKIVNYEFSEDRQRFPVSYVSGWLETNIGELNGLTNEEFYVNSTGAIEIAEGSGLLPVEENIYSTLYEIHYYEKAARDSLRGFTYGSDTDWLTIKEGDTTIQRQNKNSVAKKPLIYRYWIGICIAKCQCNHAVFSAGRACPNLE